MESALEEVAKHCHVQLMFYTQCVEKNPTNWETVCAKEKNAVTKCAEENVESLRQVKRRCADQIKTYQKCLEDNPSEPSTCVNALRALYECHNAVATESGQGA
ncbi:uncharacterized protein SPPG_02902 [Spizellomyces punctatus DAOM BR117]|uniref:IMS import disulfide relay-system CHCH-CHCH-like Cx9C domain-containing protein n=1 Tax=Spizellomyces punctatus (strain DAOM BR117) TaxID=645134 RepID=A0A0L0HMW2_SPIPD|nr:uncharacterized protein SPPG_02902 [Spizellomyces punctatus DAOM BR117]KND02437.1 hypothetical protein SPPG_02902 [Spizellomyces punctatus DAOM BR117]|eukprot:XP_016610476.1 hypothetical protein SPPG_02902 [Spizellomyces punctatus DAOM BR117]